MKPLRPYKRSPDDKLAPWYVRFEVRGKPYQWSTKTNSVTLANKRGEAYRQAIVSGAYHLSDGMKARSGVATFDKIMADYLTFPAPAERTRRSNCSGLRAVLAASCLNVSDTIDKMCAGLAVNWQKHGRKTGMPVATINSTLRRARSMFSRRAILLYEADNKPSADRVRDLFTVPALPEPEHRPELPAPDADAKAHIHLPAAPGLWRAFLLARYAGLRSREIINARKDWIEVQGDGSGILYVGGREFVAKSRKWRPVALQPVVVRDLLAGAGELLVGDHAQEAVSRRLPAALKALGFPAKKPLHSLRRLFGSIVYTTQGPRQARDALGHSTQAVTDKHYARSMDVPLAIGYAGPAAIEVAT